MMSPKAYASAWPMCRSPEGYGNMSSTYLRGRVSSEVSVEKGFSWSQSGSQRSWMRRKSYPDVSDCSCWLTDPLPLTHYCNLYSVVNVPRGAGFETRRPLRGRRSSTRGARVARYAVGAPQPAGHASPAARSASADREGVEQGGGLETGLVELGPRVGPRSDAAAGAHGCAVGVEHDRADGHGQIGGAVGREIPERTRVGSPGALLEPVEHLDRAELGRPRHGARREARGDRIHDPGIR